MSGIVARALPDVRDGLKPVHRRILYAMDEVGLRPNNAFKKSARIVGEVLGKYHPHGDTAVYDAMVRMAQGFSMRYPLADGQGNFGSIDNDPPAAMRYTEARLAAIAEEMLADLDKNTVDFTPNFDESLREPVVMPSRLPNLLLNGSSGIAVGMATNIPPHNLTEICDALIHLIDHPDATIEDLMQFVQGPDFPTAGSIFGRDGIVNAYTTGHGRIVIQAKAAIEEMPRGGRFQIVISELPFQVNKANLVEKIAELVKDRKIDGISDLRDESDRQGMRVVIELRRDAQPQHVLNNLYKHTAMQTAFSCNMLALVDGQPRVLTLRMALQQFVAHRQNVIVRRNEFDLAKARERAHILEGLKIALDHLDAVIRTIRESESAEAARGRLQDRFGLTEVQAQAILDMQLRRLAALERQKILDELAEIRKQIADLEALLADPKKVLAVIKTDLRDLKKKYGDARRTKIEQREATDFRKEDLIRDEPVAVTISFKGYIKRLPLDTFRTQTRGGRGIRGVITREADAIQQILVTQTHDQLLLFTNRGRVFPLRCWDIPESPSRQSKGLPVINLIPIDQNERVTALASIPKESEGACFLLATRHGEVKRVAADGFMNIRSTGILAMDLEPGDELGWVVRTSGHDDIIMVSEKGQAIRFAETDIRLSARASGGVRGMRLADDALAGLDVVQPDGCLLMITSAGIGKRTPLEEYTNQGRGGSGVLTLPRSRSSGPIVAARVVRPNYQVLLISREGTVIRQRADEISLQKRPARGVNVMKVDDGDQVASITCFPETDGVGPRQSAVGS